MPALTLFGRRWNVGSDDLPVVAIWPTLFHGAWSVILFSGWLALDRPKDCSHGPRYTIALAGLGVSFFVNFLVGCWLEVESLRGMLYV